MNLHTRQSVGEKKPEDTLYMYRDARVETKYKERSQCRGRRAVLRLRRVFRTRTLVERGDEEVRSKRVDLWRKRTGCPWSIDLPHGTRQSIVPWDSPSLSRSRRTRRSLSFSPSSSSSIFRFLRSFLQVSPCPAYNTIVGHESRMAEQVEGAAETIWTMRRDEILFQKLNLNCVLYETFIIEAITYYFRLMNLFGQ